MMKKILTIGLLFGFGLTATNAVTVTNFGSGGFTPQSFGNDFGVDSQSGSSISISGFASNQLSGVLATTPGDITGLDLQVSSSSFTGSGGFTITFFNTGFGESATYTGGSFSELQADNFTLLTLDSFTSSAVFSDIAAVQLGGTGSPATAVSGTLTELSAVPEPSTYAALAGILALGFAMVRRRRV